jgi:hypothetical protein
MIINVILELELMFPLPGKNRVVEPPPLHFPRLNPDAPTQCNTPVQLSKPRILERTMGLARDEHPPNKVLTRGASPELDYNPRQKPLGNDQLGPSTSGQNQGAQRRKPRERK